MDDRHLFFLDEKAFFFFVVAKTKTLNFDLFLFLSSGREYEPGINPECIFIFGFCVYFHFRF